MVRVAYNFISMADECGRRGLQISPTRLSEAVLHKVPIKRDVNNVIPSVVRDATVEFMNSMIRSLNKADWSKFLSEKIEY